MDPFILTPTGAGEGSARRVPETGPDPYVTGPALGLRVSSVRWASGPALTAASTARATLSAWR
jgi:hypothetical protein